MATCYRGYDAATMQAWEVRSPGPLDTRPLVLVDRPVPQPGPGEVRVRVVVCGVCRTDLHLAEGDLRPRRPATVPGHEVVGIVDALGEGCVRFRPGDRIGIAWLRSTCGVCRFCLRGSENLCVEPRFTGWDDDGGYAEYAVVDERYSHALPAKFSDEKAAPLLCAGIIGWRALHRVDLPPGGTLGIYGFGASAHLAAQVALHQGATVHVVTRSAAARRLALDLGAASALSPGEGPPDLLDAALIFAPSGDLVPEALGALDRGGTLGVAGVHLSAIPPLDYAAHLFYERRLVSTTANTRSDGEEFLRVAAAIDIEVKTVPYPLSEADTALVALAGGQVTGAAVLRVGAG